MLASGCRVAPRLSIVRNYAAFLISHVLEGSTSPEGKGQGARSPLSPLIWRRLPFGKFLHCL